jgi:hypothetical protein
MGSLPTRCPWSNQPVLWKKRYIEVAELAVGVVLRVHLEAGA